MIMDENVGAEDHEIGINEDTKAGLVRIEPCLICSCYGTNKKWRETFQFLPGSEGCGILNDQMLSIFILRKLLQYPKRECSKLIEESEGVSNPGSWFVLCDSCSETVKLAMTAYLQILNLENELESLKIKLKGAICHSVKTEGGNEGKHIRRIEKFPGEFIDPRTKIRSHFIDSFELLVPKNEVQLENCDEENWTSNQYPHLHDESLEDGSSWNVNGNIDFTDDPDQNDSLFLFDSDSERPRPKVKRSRNAKLGLEGIQSSNQNEYTKDVLQEKETSEGSEEELEEEGYKYGGECSNSSKNTFQLCKICGTKFRNPRSFDRHMINHTKYQTYVCSICNYPCSTERSLKSHRAKRGCKQIKDEAMFKESETHSTNPTPKETASKKLDIEKKSKFLLQCSICGCKYINKKSYTTHMVRHNQYKDTTCDVCHYPCPSVKALADHQEKGLCDLVRRSDVVRQRKPGIQTQVNVKKKKTLKDSCEQFKKEDGLYYCSLCPTVLGKRAAFVKHRRDHRKTNDIFKCKVCTYPAKTHLTLQRHMKVFHKHYNYNCIQNWKPNSPNDTKDMDKNEDASNSTLLPLNNEEQVDPEESSESNVNGNLMEKVDIKDPDWMSDSGDDSGTELDNDSNEKQVKSKKRSDYTYTCKLCMRTFKNSKHFKQHSTNHEKYKETTCPKCNYPFCSQQTLKAHLKKNLCMRRINMEWTCSKCNFVTKWRYKLSAHLSVHRARETSKKREEHVCEICKRKFKNSDSFNAHMSDHENFKEFTCSKCNFPCASELDLKFHTKHEICDRTDGKRIFKCDICSYSTGSKTLLEYHLQKHKTYDNSETSDGRLKCGECNEIFQNKRQLCVHKRDVHGSVIGIPVYKCTFCPNTYSRKGSLKDHIKQIHKKDCRFYCEICGYGTNMESVLKKHSFKHNGEYPYVCELCGLRYRYATGLATHMKQQHSEGNQAAEKGNKYECKYCYHDKAAFTSKALLNVHLKSAHSDLYVHKCDECDNSYMSVASLQLHKKINHSNDSQSVNCQFCEKKFFSRYYLYAHYGKGYCKKQPPDFKFTVPREKSGR